MKYVEHVAWIACQSVGCDAGRAIDSRHVENISASGGYYCPEHENEVPC